MRGRVAEDCAGDAACFTACRKHNKMLVRYREALDQIAAWDRSAERRAARAREALVPPRGHSRATG